MFTMKFLPFTLYLVCVSECRKSYLPLDENILDEVFEYEIDLLNTENDGDSKEEEAPDYYYYDDDDKSTIPGKAGRDYPMYDNIPNTQFQCRGEHSSSHHNPIL